MCGVVEGVLGLGLEVTFRGVDDLAERVVAEWVDVDVPGTRVVVIVVVVVVVIVVIVIFRVAIGISVIKPRHLESSDMVA